MSRAADGLLEQYRVLFESELRLRQTQGHVLEATRCAEVHAVQLTSTQSANEAEGIMP